MDQVSLRLQRFDTGDQILVLGRLAEGRSETGRFGGSTGWYDVVLVQGVSTVEVEEAVDGATAGSGGWQW